MALLRNTTSRLVALHLLLMAGATVLSLGFVLWSTERVISAEVQGVVEAEATGLLDTYRTGGIFQLARAIDRRVRDAAARDVVYLLADTRGQRLSGNLSAWPPTVTPGGGWTRLEVFRTDRERPARLVALSLQLGGGERLLIGRDDRATAAFRTSLTEGLVAALLAMAAVSALTAWLILRVIRRRIDDVAGTAAQIMRGDMGGRVPVRGTDAFDTLAVTLNTMLGRIELLVTELRAVTDSLAHDLRTPLTRLSHRLSELREESHRPEALAALTAAEGEVARLLRMLGALLAIARLEAGVAGEPPAPVDAAALLADLADLFQPSADEAGVTIAVSTPGAPPPLAGHRQFLAQALTNLLENALRYAPAGSVVSLALAAAPDGIHLTVADRGPGIPAADRARAVERFVTLDPSRAGSGGGLGLSLVDAVARLHHGRLDLADNAPGLRATLVLPPGGLRALGSVTDP